MSNFILKLEYMAGFQHFNAMGHRTINTINDFTHQLFGTMCDVIHHVVPQTNIGDEADDTVHRHILSSMDRNANYLKIVAYIPGSNKDQVHLSLCGNTLQLTATTNHKDLTHFNFIQNITYSHNYQVPIGTTSEHITCHCLDGVLKILITTNDLTPQTTSTPITIQ